MQLEVKVTDILESLKQLNVRSPLPFFHPQNPHCFLMLLMNSQIVKVKSAIYNLPESPTPNMNADTSILNDLCNFLGVDVQISSITRLGKELTNKIRPLHIWLDKAGNKWKILSRLPQLRSNTKRKIVYVNPDMTTAERKTNQLLQEELKERRKKEERSLVIWKNKIL